ncbi:siphovirus ReqiPepy6 Gp37-like family protein [Tissierella sp.]|uniref:siphovirus ReqiPepy6 Gp37-like family protein n=1 Tax=Tissierella sp. TaxID=41274 RepID=UPI0028A59A59|nr:siphovirus ReqiPepy6 Gp37-like family protein [Tissierella sp.]
MELYIFDMELNFQGIIESFISFRWIRRYHKSGSFELHCNLTIDALQLLKIDNILWLKGDDEAGYIVCRNIKQNSRGEEILVVKGSFLTSYLDRRINWYQITHDGLAIDFMKKIINDNAINPLNPNRKIPLLIFNSDATYKDKISYQNTYGNVLEQLENISRITNIGYRIRFDYVNKKLIFETYKGENRSINQSNDAPAVFSREFENILEQEYMESLDNYKNTVLVAGEGEGTGRKIVTIEEGEGLDRYELFVDARDLQSEKENGEKISEDKYIEMLVNRGKTKLAELKKVESFDSKINLKSNLIYKEDFDLGDIVTVLNKKWGVIIDARITEIEEVYESNGFNVNIIFGNDAPGLIEKIKQVVR